MSDYLSVVSQNVILQYCNIATNYPGTYRFARLLTEVQTAEKTKTQDSLPGFLNKFIHHQKFHTSCSNVRIPSMISADSNKASTPVL